MAKVLCFGASSSRNSINKQFASWAVSQLKDTEIKLIDLNDFEMPIFSVDREAQGGIPEAAKEFKQLIRENDALLISLAEHNGSYTAAFKNIFDWTSRIEKSMWLDRPVFLMATSPGARGGQSVLGNATRDWPYRNGKIVASFSLPQFQKNFSAEEGITDPDLRDVFFSELKKFEEALFEVSRV